MYIYEVPTLTIYLYHFSALLTCQYELVGYWVQIHILYFVVFVFYRKSEGQGHSANIATGKNTPKRYQGLMERTNHSARQISFIRGDNLLFTTSRGRESRDDPDMVLYSLLLKLEKYSDQNQI